MVNVIWHDWRSRAEAGETILPREFMRVAVVVTRPKPHVRTLIPQIQESACEIQNFTLNNTNTNHISHHTLDVICEGLARVKESGGHVDISTWLPHSSSKSTTILPPSEHHNLAELKDVCAALQSLSVTASHGVSLLEQNLKKKSRNPTTVLSLPDETSAEIFEWNNTYDGEGGLLFIALGSGSCLVPALHKLVVSLNESLRKDSYMVFKPRVDNFLQIVAKHTQRWREFRCAIDNEVVEETTEAFNRYENLKCPMLNCPMLKKISFINRTTNWAPIMLSYSTWTMPSLVEFKGQKSIPQIAVVKSLVAMDLELTSGNGWDVRDLNAALVHVTALEIVVIRFSAHMMNALYTPSTAHLSFPTLKHLELHFAGSDREVGSFLGGVWATFEAPVATNLTLKTKIYRSADRNLQLIVPNSSVFPSLKTFRFLTNTSTPFEQDTFPLFLRGFRPFNTSTWAPIHLDANCGEYFRIATHFHPYYHCVSYDAAMFRTPLYASFWLNCRAAPRGFSSKSSSYKNALVSPRDISNNSNN
ncbi:hypothetical protein BD410DRAFT_810043 [Rickenella mellea]|uniref:Uncharacterized protein n=1 Tax=Rickenella mellea TaxID=50990 RepID=A0A4Y7PF98_9AGAM|nr:hypothetical protein BD410DRAFT_810043 [Rickenella mellea]